MGGKTRRIVHQIKELCSILSGLLLAADYKIGQKLFQDRDFEENAGFFQDMYRLILIMKDLNLAVGIK